MRKGGSERASRSKELDLTAAGETRLGSALKGWTAAQARFEPAFGRDRTAGLGALLREAVKIDLSQAAEQPIAVHTPDGKADQ
jgi:hypothetical protein